MIVDKTTQEIAKLYRVASDNVAIINADANYTSYQSANPSSILTETEWKSKIERNVKHLEQIKSYRNEDTTSIWTTEDFTAIDAAIEKGKTLYA